MKKSREIDCNKCKLVNKCIRKSRSKCVNNNYSMYDPIDEENKESEEISESEEVEELDFIQEHKKVDAEIRIKNEESAEELIEISSPEETAMANINSSTSLVDIANLAQQDINIGSALSDHTIDNMKAFLVVYTRSQLTRVIKLTDALDKLENQLINQATGEVELDPLTLMSVIRTIQNSLSASLNLIKQITTDESYINVIVNQTNNINATLNNCLNSPKIILPDQNSRERVRNIVNQILDKTRIDSDIVDSSEESVEVVEVDEESEE